MSTFKVVNLLLASVLASAPLCRADLVAHYALDETDDSASPAVDSLGNNPGNIIGGEANLSKGVASAMPHLNTAYHFEIRGGLNIGTSQAARPSDQWTMTWWMRPDTLDPFDRIYESLAGTGNDGNGIRIDLGGSPGDSLRVLLRDGNGSTSTSLTHPLNLTADNWYFCTVRYDSSLGNGTALKITVLPAGIDNIPANTVTAATRSANSLGTGPITIHGSGAFIAADDAGASGANDFGGSLDDFSIFQTGDTFGVLSDEQVARIHNIGALAFDPPVPVPEVQSFTVSPANAASGDVVTLSWNVSNASSVEIVPDVGPVAISGETQVTVTATKIYTLSATNAEGTVTATAQVTVNDQSLPARISEFVASNSGSLLDGDGNASDWIEIHNPNLSNLDISGYHLTDDPLEPDKWPFPPDTVLAGGEYLVVFASDRQVADYIDPEGNLHTSFSLNSDGEYLALVATDGMTVIQDFFPQFPPIPEDVSYGTEGFFTEPTPRAVNSPAGVTGFVEDTSFNIDRGFFSAPFDLVISTATDEAEIYYTTDGSAPSPSSGTLYTAPLKVTSTTVVRAAAYKDDFAPTNIDTHTYLFLSDVLAQPNNPPGLPRTWAGRPADYEMDPDIVTDPDYATELIPALQAFPTLSVAIDPGDFYGAQGLYQNPQSQGDAWERAVSAELMVHDDSEKGFQIEAGLRIQGGSSRNPDTPKHSMSLRFRKQYGPGKLRYDVFRDAPGSDTATDEFDFLQLRSGYNFGWVHRHYFQSRHAQYNRDQFANDLYLAMGNPGSHGRWAHLYINGLYWGIYHLHERPDADYMTSYFGNSEDGYDAINSGRAANGSMTAYNRMTSLAAGNISDPDNYKELGKHLDINAFIDYMLMNFYTGNRDWDGHNWRAAGQGPGGEPFRFFPWDSEFAISPNGAGAIQNPAPLSAALTANVTSKNGNNRPSGIHQDLTNNEEYRLQFADHIRHHMFNGGPLSPEGATAIWRHRSDKMNLPIVAESARWGDFRRDVQAGSQWNSSQYDLYTRNDHYFPDQQWIITTYLQQRRDIVVNQLRNRDLYPQTAAPDYNQHGGLVPTGFLLSMTNSNAGGVIYFTLDGTDPRTTAGPAEDIVLLQENTPATALVQNTDGGLATSWTNNNFDDSSWQSGATGIGFESTAAHYDPLTNLYVPQMNGVNSSCLVRVAFSVADQATLGSIAGLTLNMKYDDGYSAFINGKFVGGRNNPATLAWNSRATTSHPDSQALLYDQLDISAAIPNLQIGSNMLAIQGLNVSPGSSDFLIVPQITYTTGVANGVSQSAQVYNNPVELTSSGPVNARILENGTWSALNSAGFIVGSPANTSNLVVSEIHYNPAGAEEADEFIELMNISGEPVQLAGVSFSAGLTYTFPITSELAGGARIFLTPADYTGNLDNGGEQLTLLDTAGAIIESFTYNDRSPWPEAPDGNGPSLVRIAPGLQLDPSLPSSWRSSSSSGGNPGASDATSFTGGDILAYALGPSASLHTGIEDGHLSLDYSRKLSADDIIYTIEISTDLTTWKSGDTFTRTIDERLPQPDGTTVMITRSLVPVSDSPRQYLRLRVTKR